MKSKTILGEKITCNTCNGTGEVQAYPHYTTQMPDYAIQMPEKITCPCFDCDGEGYFLVVPDRVKIIRRSQIHLAINPESN